MTKALRALRLFNEKAEKLKNSSFLQTMLTSRTGCTLSWTKEEGFKQELRGPQQDSIEAFVLTFRFFQQDNEPSSLRNLAKTYDSLIDLHEAKDKFIEARKYLNNFLDSTSEFQIIVNKEILTNRRIMDVIIYGGLAHANEEYEKHYKAWMQNPFINVPIQNEFAFILTEFLRVILYVQEVNNEVLKELEKQS